METFIEKEITYNNRLEFKLMWQRKRNILFYALKSPGKKQSGGYREREWIQLAFQGEPLTIIQRGRELWEDPVNDGWMTAIETATRY